MARHPGSPVSCVFPHVLDSGAGTGENQTRPRKSTHFLGARDRCAKLPRGNAPDSYGMPSPTPHTPFTIRSLCMAVLPLFLIPALGWGQAVEIGSRRELFVDRHLIADLHHTTLRMHEPVKAPRPQSPLPERHMMTVIKDGDLYAFRFH